MIHKLFLIFILFCATSSNAQFCKRDFIEQACHYPIEGKELLLSKVDTFLYLMSIQDTTAYAMIDEEDIKLWLTPFDEISTYLKYPDYNKPSIVGLMDEEPNLYMVKILFECYPDSTQHALLGVYSLYLKYNPELNSYKFKDYRTVQIPKKYDTIKVGNIVYYSQNISKLDLDKCREFDEFNTEIANTFGVPPKRINYFFSKNCTELLNIFGWDIVYNMFYCTTGGFAKYGGKGKYEYQIMSGNNSERYDHELIHLYYKTLLTNDTNTSTLIIDEGLATFFGGSSGLTYQELKQNLKAYLLKTDSVNILDHYKSRVENIQIDKNTNYIYTMGAFIIELYYKKQGLVGLKKLANYNNSNLVENLSKDFGVRVENLDAYLRKQLFANQND